MFNYAIWYEKSHVQISDFHDDDHDIIWNYRA